jgi:2-oxo-4-hydroxy-4-carboxy--5-ureidoimidazoline (OHCU) decarboxylase
MLAVHREWWGDVSIPVPAKMADEAFRHSFKNLFERSSWEQAIDQVGALLMG